jgi:hypothetical protein
MPSKGFTPRVKVKERSPEPQGWHPQPAPLSDRDLKKPRPIWIQVSRTGPDGEEVVTNTHLNISIDRARKKVRDIALYESGVRHAYVLDGRMPAKYLPFPDELAKWGCCWAAGWAPSDSGKMRVYLPSSMAQEMNSLEAIAQRMDVGLEAIAEVQVIP